MITGRTERGLNREKDENREIGKARFGSARLQGAAKKWFYAVSSQVVVRLVTNVATQKLSPRSLGRAVDFISIATDQPAMSRAKLQRVMTRTLVRVELQHKRRIGKSTRADSEWR